MPGLLFFHVRLDVTMKEGLHSCHTVCMPTSEKRTVRGISVGPVETT